MEGEELWGVVLICLWCVVYSGVCVCVSVVEGAVCVFVVRSMV